MSKSESEFQQTPGDEELASLWEDMHVPVLPVEKEAEFEGKPLGVLEQEAKKQVSDQVAQFREWLDNGRVTLISGTEPKLVRLSEVETEPGDATYSTEISGLLGSGATYHNKVTFSQGGDVSYVISQVHEPGILHAPLGESDEEQKRGLLKEIAFFVPQARVPDTFDIYETPKSYLAIQNTLVPKKNLALLVKNAASAEKARRK